MLSPDEISDLRARASITKLAGDLGVTLTWRGGRLSGRCPLCGGGKRSVRFEVKRAGTAEETFVCAVCQEGGDVIRLAQLGLNIGFREAVERLGGARVLSEEEAARIRAKADAETAKREAEAARYREAERRRCLAIWRGSLPALGSPIEDYLRGRAIQDVAAMRVRFAPEQGYFEGETVDDRGRWSPRLIHRGPAMLAPILDAGGAFRGLHITWIDPARPGKKANIFDPDDGEALNPKKMRGSKAGGYIDALPGGDGSKVYLGEGIETLASVREAKRDGAVYRVAGDLGNLAGPALKTLPHPTLKGPGGRPQRAPGPEPDLEREACPIPDACRDLVLVKDGDSDPFLTDRAMERAAARHKRPGRRIRIADPGEGIDFNDDLMR